MDDEEFLYGAEDTPAHQPDQQPPPSISTHESLNNTFEDDPFANDLLEDEEPPPKNGVEPDGNASSAGDDEQEIAGDEQADDEEEEEEEESDSDVEIILEVPTRSVDFRLPSSQNRAQPAPASITPAAPAAPRPALTTEYTPLGRGTPINQAAPAPAARPKPADAPAHQPSPTPANATPTTAPPPTTLQQTTAPSTTITPASQENFAHLPVVTAPPSHPSIDPTLPGTYSSRSIYEVDLHALAAKDWRKPGSDLSDWFNYGFDELSWEAYCVRRRELGDMASVLKANVLNLAGMNEDALQTVPPEMRSALIAQSAMMGGNVPPSFPVPQPGGGPQIPVGNGVSNGPPNQMSNANGPFSNMSGGPINPNAGAFNMMPHPDMMAAGIGPGGMGNMGNMMGDMGAPGGGPMMQNDGENANGMDGFQPGGPPFPPPPVQMGMGMGLGMPMPGPDFAPNMPDGSGMPGMPPQQMFNPMDMGAGRGGPGFRGRGRGFAGPGVTGVPGAPGRGGAFAGRGRGWANGAPQALPQRPASPLPPNVPTGPRNLNRYKDKDRDGGAAGGVQVDGLDYGGGGERDDRSSRDERERDRDRDRDRERDRERDRDRSERKDSYSKDDRRDDKDKDKSSRKRTHSIDRDHGRSSKSRRER